MRIEDCVSMRLTQPCLQENDRIACKGCQAAVDEQSRERRKVRIYRSSLPSQTDWSVQGKRWLQMCPSLTSVMSIEIPVSSKSRDTHWMASPYPIPSSSIPRGAVQPSRRLFSWDSYTLEWGHVQSSTVMLPIDIACGIFAQCPLCSWIR